MINNVILMGRITREPELKQTSSGISVLQFGIAVERNYAKPGEERQADFVTCVAWRQTADFIAKYFQKGSLITLEGNLRSRIYEDDKGVKHYLTEVYVDSVSFTGEKKKGSDLAKPYDPAPLPDSSIPDDFAEVLNDGGVPFF